MYKKNRTDIYIYSLFPPLSTSSSSEMESISSKPPSHHNDRYVRTGDSFVTNGNTRISPFTSSIGTSIVVSSQVRSLIFSLSLKSKFEGGGESFKPVTGTGDWILLWISLSETLLMMRRSTFAISLLAWMQFFPNYLITLTWHLATPDPEWQRGSVFTHYIEKYGCPPCVSIHIHIHQDHT